MKPKFNQIDAIQIRFNDIDLMGHVNNAVIGEYFDLGRMNYLHSLFGGSVKMGEESLVIASTKNDFFIPILIGHTISVCTRIYEIGNKSIKMEQLIMDSSNVIYAQSHTVLVAISVDTKEAIVVPEQWKVLIKRIDSDCVVKEKVI